MTSRRPGRRGTPSRASSLVDSSAGVDAVAVIYPAHASFSVCRAENLLIGLVFLEPRPSTLAPFCYNKRRIGWAGDDRHRVQRLHGHKTKRHDPERCPSASGMTFTSMADAGSTRSCRSKCSASRRAGLSSSLRTRTARTSSRSFRSRMAMSAAARARPSGCGHRHCGHGHRGRSPNGSRIGWSR